MKAINRKRKKKMCIVIMVLIVVVLIAGGAVYAYVNRPQEMIPANTEERPPQPMETEGNVYELY